MPRLQSSVSNVNLRTAQHWIRVTHLFFSTAAAATLSIIMQLPDAWHTMWHTHRLHIRRNWSWYHNWLIHPDLMDSTSPSVPGHEGLCWVHAYYHKDKSNSQLSRAWLKRGRCCKMYFLENNDFQLCAFLSPSSTQTFALAPLVQVLKTFYDAQNVLMCCLVGNELSCSLDMMYLADRWNYQPAFCQLFPWCLEQSQSQGNANGFSSIFLFT
jgi:hypothetical protein